jgi:hypothetical protein
LIHGNTDIIPDLTLPLLEVPTTSAVFPAALTTLLPEVPMAAAMYIVLDLP